MPGGSQCGQPDMQHRPILHVEFDIRRKLLDGAALLACIETAEIHGMPGESRLLPDHLKGKLEAGLVMEDGSENLVPAHDVPACFSQPVRVKWTIEEHPALRPVRGRIACLLRPDALLLDREPET